jgi:cytochrome c-type biogenesis protein
MLFDVTSYALSFLAGVLSILSPCVLPLIPIIIGGALNTHKLGPYVLALGLAISFTVVGVFLATIGASLGLDIGTFRNVAAVLLFLFGIILLSPTLQATFAAATAGLGNAGQNTLSRFSADSLAGQFILGMLLGLVWSPCVGPILGAAITLASQGEQLGHVVAVMAFFGLGAGLPLIILGLLSRQTMQRMRNKLFIAGKVGKQILGGLMLLIAIMILTGLDKQLESILVQVSPDWLTNLTTRF